MNIDTDPLHSVVRIPSGSRPAVRLPELCLSEIGRPFNGVFRHPGRRRGENVAQDGPRGLLRNGGIYKSLPRDYLR